MKANRKYIEADERAVSAVIGVILMVAITVAIAATVYVYVSGMIGGQRQQSPTLQFTVDESLDRLVVATTSPSVPWTGIQIRPDQDVKIFINGEVLAAAGVDVAANYLHTILAAHISGGVSPYYISASDFIDVEGGTTAAPLLSNNVKIAVVHTDTGTTLGTYTIITVAAIV